MIDFDLSLLPESQRFDFWRDVGSRIYRPVSCGLEEEQRLTVRSRNFQFADAAIGRIVASPQLYERTPAMVREDGVDWLLLVGLESGEIRGDVGEHFVARAGDLLLLDLANAGRSMWSQHRAFYANIPRCLISPLLLKKCECGPPILRSSDPTSRLLMAHLHELWASASRDCGESGMRMMIGLAEMIKVYFCGDFLPLDAVRSKAGGDLLLPAIQEWIRENLHLTGLDASMLCARFHISRSRLYGLFEPVGGVRSFIQALRLDMAMILLRSGDVAAHSIRELADGLGFSSPSVFSRAFRARWGCSPRDVRGGRRHGHAVDFLPREAGSISRSENQLIRSQLVKACDYYYSLYSSSCRDR